MMNKKSLIVLLIFFLLIMSGCSLIQLAEPNLTGETTATPVSEPTVAEAKVQSIDYETITAINSAVLSVVQDTYQTIYTDVNPSVVNIQVTEAYGWTTATGEGSGFVWDDKGNIVTNNHVIDNANNITVVFSDGTTTSAKVVGSDPQSDLAVIKVDPTLVSLVPVQMGDSQDVKVGDLVIAIGNPYGLSGTMTQGIVSALSRSLTVDESDMFSQTNYTIPDIIQTDAAINPGNSGGVLVNMAGEVIGVTAAIQSSSNSNAGIGFVIPAHIVSRVVPVLISSGKYIHPSLGLAGITITPSIATEMDLDTDVTGILITGITSGGAADKAGLIGSVQQLVGPGRLSITYGDVITAVDGQPLRTYEELISYIFNQTEVGQTISLSVLRDGKELTIDLKLQGE